MSDGNGIEVLASHSALINSQPLMAFLLELKASEPKMFAVDVCAEPENPGMYINDEE